MVTGHGVRERPGKNNKDQQVPQHGRPVKLCPQSPRGHGSLLPARQFVLPAQKNLPLLAGLGSGDYVLLFLTGRSRMPRL
jgi:hypothetical protein